MAQPTYIVYPSVPGISAANTVPVTPYEPVQQAISNYNGQCDGAGVTHVVQTPRHPEPTDVGYTPITLEDALSNYGSYYHAAHVVLYSRRSQLLRIESEHVQQPAEILILLREDGYLGFPGGHIEPNVDTSILSGLNRELKEEINMKRKHQVTQADYISSTIHHQSRHVLHFYAHELSPKDFTEVQNCAMGAVNKGLEVAGVIQVPLYVLADGRRGFPSFLSNMFSGQAKDQLIQAIVQRNLMPPQQISDLVNKANQFRRLII